MKHKVADLKGALLDAAVAKAQGWETGRADGINWWWSVPFIDRHNPSNAEAAVARTQYASGYRPSIDWQQGGPIIDRERIAVVPARDGGWHAFTDVGGFLDEDLSGQGAPYLIAAMRAFCASKFGEEVELP